MASWWTNYILQNASRYGLDPRAALAVASAEGLGGGIGDAGTSFGPFQLHVGGALPSGRGRAWAESQAGINYALSQMGAARGLRGRAAIEAIVRQFERPADPTGEIARAWAAYSGGKLPAGIGAGAGAPPPSPPTLGHSVAGFIEGDQGRTKPRTIMRQTRVFDPLAFSQGIFSSLSGGGTPDIGQLATSSYKNVEIPFMSPGKPLPPKMRRTLEKMPPQAQAKMKAVLAKNGWAVPLSGKVIGTPGAGTHTLGNWESDRALDIAAPVGTPVYAPFGGMVGSQFGSLGSKNPRMAGLRLHVRAPTGQEWYGAHLSRFAPGIRPGVRVRPGQLIGYSGMAAGVGHLHEALNWGDPYSLIH